MPALITTETQHLEFQWKKIGAMARQNLLNVGDQIVPVVKENGKGSTVDRFFLLSVDELDPEKTPYAYYRDIRNRVKFDPAGYADWYWTRSPYRSGAYGAWSVNPSGSVTTNYYASYAYRVSPACVLIF